MSYVQLSESKLKFTMPISLGKDDHLLNLNVSVFDRLSKEISSRIIQINVLNVELNAIPDRTTFESNITNHFNVKQYLKIIVKSIFG